MPLTPAQIKAKIVEKLAPKHLEELTWAEMVSAIQSTPQAHKDRLVDLLRTGIKQHEVGEKLHLVIMKDMITQAETEADTIMADGSFSLDEFNRVFGDG